METTSGPAPVRATARSASWRTASRAGSSSALRNGATCAMPSRHEASSAGVDSPVATSAVRSRTLG
jgi:hypothetical protein